MQACHVMCEVVIRRWSSHDHSLREELHPSTLFRTPFQWLKRSESSRKSGLSETAFHIHALSTFTATS